MLTDSHMHSFRGFISRVPMLFRRVSREAFEPHLISIGPFHHAKETLKDAKKHKFQYTESIISRSPNTSVVLVDNLRKIEANIRECYAEPISFTSDELIEMMMFDGCFILELLHKYQEMKCNAELKDGLLKEDLTTLRRDLVLLDNQIPLIVLDCLFNLLKCPEQTLSLTEFIIDFFDPMLPAKLVGQNSSNTQGKHILDLLRNHLLQDSPISNCIAGSEESPMYEYITCATELEKIGVKFKAKDIACNLLDISFTMDGVFEMPGLFVGGSWVDLFSNMIALEQSHRDYSDQITSYVILLHKLINSSVDVSLLCDNGVISGFSVNDGIKKLCQQAVVHNFYYHELCGQVMAYQKARRLNVQREALKKLNYHRNLWSNMSSVAVVLLLLLILNPAWFPFVFRYLY